VIRQAISCDICGAEKKQTNHWFVAYNQAGELRVSGWNSRNRLRAESKHLCGQTCLHKLVDEFFARTVANRSTVAVSDNVEVDDHNSIVASGLTENLAYEEVESSARVVPAPAPVTQPRPLIAQPAAIAPSSVVSMPTRLVSSEPRPVSTPPVIEQPSTYSSRHLRAEAWEREREREMRALERRPDLARRRKSS
jgi:hypothetical protein